MLAVANALYLTSKLVQFDLLLNYVEGVVLGQQTKDKLGKKNLPLRNAVELLLFEAKNTDLTALQLEDMILRSGKGRKCGRDMKRQGLIRTAIVEFFCVLTMRSGFSSVYSEALTEVL